MTQLKIGILGLGTVGSSVVNLISKNANLHTRKLAGEIKVTHAAVRDLTKERNCDTASIQLTTDPMAVVCSDVDMIIEVMGGINDAYACVMKAIERKIPVVTANKTLLALKGDEIFSFAKQQNVYVGFEASCMGGIPVIGALRQGLAASPVSSIMGILNGTCNYILSEMEKKGSSFEDTLREAQRLGYAEASPDTDIKGLDTAHKLTILTSIAFGVPLNYEAINIKGIDFVTAQDIKKIGKLDGRIRLIGRASRIGDSLTVSVEPMVLAKQHSLAQVDDVKNGIIINTAATGDTFYSGRGAGGEPTASAILANIIEFQQALRSMPALGFDLDALEPIPVIADENCNYYVHFSLTSSDDKEAVRETIIQTLPNVTEGRTSPGSSKFIIIAENINIVEIDKLINELLQSKHISEGHAIKIDEAFVGAMKSRLELPSIETTRHFRFAASGSGMPLN